MIDGRRLSVVLGGGGLKGLAHVGVLKVLERRGIVPDEYVGTSVGSYIAALAAGGMSASEIEEVALTIRLRDVLDKNWLRLIWSMYRSRGLCRGKALHDFIRRTLPVDRFDQLRVPIYITSVDLDNSRETVWGMPGYTEVPIHDCVMASCSLPGIYPPKKINRYHFVDGSLLDPLPIKVSIYNKADHILAVYLDCLDNSATVPSEEGILTIVTQAQSILSRTLVRHNLHHFEKAPVTLIQPLVEKYGFFDFDHATEIIRAGEVAAEEALLTFNPSAEPLRR